MMKTFPDIDHPGQPSRLTISNPAESDLPVEPELLNRIINHVEENENVTFREIELVYVDENGIIEINKTHLGRDYVTDIISFRYDEEPGNSAIEGTLFCCAPRIAEQSKEFNTNKRTEFYRIFIHGLLHLAGYNDDTKEKKAQMTRLEDTYLNKNGVSF